ncbi:MAG: stage II sporulation protein M [Proteobacteria bacterium]|nr:stage II sporulation protein M [Pseudomonadota bacterium]
MGTEQLTIASATGVDVSLPIAGPGSRSYAFVIDWHVRLLLAAAWFLAGTLIVTGALLPRSAALDSRTFALGVLLPSLALYFLYHPVLETAFGGRTPGKRIAGVRLVTRRGDTPSPGALLIRNLFRVIDSLPAFYLVGLLACFATRDRVRIGDLAAGTVLVLDQRAALAALDGYRALARDLATVRRWPGAASLARGLESLYATYHAAISRPPHRLRAALLKLLREEAPAVVRSLRAPLGWVVLLFALGTGAGWWLVSRYPELAGLIASEDMIEHVERGELWTDGLLNVTPSSVVSLRILSNNVAVTIAAFCAGAFYGLGTVYLITLNGLLLGGAFALTHQHGLDGRLFAFIVAHGTVELSVICLAGAAGVALGGSLVHPEYPTRRESFERRTAELAKLLLPCALLLTGCGLIEGFVSPDARVPLSARVAIGVGYWLVMAGVLSGRLFGARRPLIPGAGA